MITRLVVLAGMLTLVVQAQFVGQSPPRLIRRVEPVYPPLAKAMRIRGIVRLAVAIDPEGNVAGIRLISGHPLLVKAAFDAVKQWKYTPAMRFGEPVPTAFEMALRFYPLQSLYAADEPAHI